MSQNKPQLPSDERAYLQEVIVATRDILVELSTHAGYLPAQKVYSTKLTEPELKLIKYIKDLDSIIARFNVEAL